MDKPVLVVGDLIFDLFYDLEPRSESHGVPVFAVKETQDELGVPWVVGGAGNVAGDLRALGVEVDLFGIVETDDDAVLISKRLDGVVFHGVSLGGEPWSMPFKHWHRKEGVVVPRHDFDSRRSMSIETERYVVQTLRRIIRRHRYGAIVLSDYIKGTVTPAVASNVIAAALQKKTRVPVLVDTKRRDLSRFEDAASIQVSDGIDRHVKKPDCEALIETRAEAGVILHRPDSPPAVFPAMSRNPINLIGAGDAFIAGCAKSISRGESWVDAMQWGSYAAMLRVETVPEQEIRPKKAFSPNLS